VRRLSRSNEGHERPAETQDGVRTSFSGLRSSVFGESRISAADRGTGPVKGTGFYEGSLSVEGTSGRHESSSFTRRWSRRPWRLPHAGDSRGSTLQKREQPRLMALRRQRPERPAEVRERRQGCQRLDRFRQRRGTNKPTPALTHAALATWMQLRTGHYGSASLASVRRSVLGCRETSGPPINSAEPKTPWDVHAAKVAAASREHTRYGYTSIVRVAEVGQTHRVSWFPISSNACWRSRALA